MIARLERIFLRLAPPAVSALIPVTIWCGFYWVPTDAGLGLSQRIFYYHVPSATTSFLGFAVGGVASAVYLATGREDWLSRREDGTAWSRGYFVDPGHPDAARFTTDVALNIVREYDIDGLHLDYIRYPARADGQSWSAETNPMGLPGGDADTVYTVSFGAGAYGVVELFALNAQDGSVRWRRVLSERAPAITGPEQVQVLTNGGWLVAVAGDTAYGLRLESP